MTTLEKKAFIKKMIYLILILLAISVITTTSILLFSKRYDFIGWVNALFFTGFLIFAFSWMMIISNENLFTVPIYGVKQFLSSLIGRKPKKTLLEYRDSRTHVDRYIIVTTMIFGTFFMVLAISIYYIFS